MLHYFSLELVPTVGLEPTRLTATDFKSVVSTIPPRGLLFTYKEALTLVLPRKDRIREYHSHAF